MEQLAQLLENHRIELEQKQKIIESMLKIVESVANVGVDFGYGKYQIEQKDIDMARGLILKYKDS